jgi:ribosomal protein L3 glutamine methyltransferase
VARHGLEERVHVLEGDLWTPVAGRRYELIVSNPPYVGDAEMDALPPEYRHEPDMALRAAEDGLAIVRRILEDASEHLTEEGVLVVEVGNSAAAVMEAWPDLPFTWLEFERGGSGVFLLTAEELA